jgi:hypothetical protein
VFRGSLSLSLPTDSRTSLRERLADPFGGASDVFLFGTSSQRGMSAQSPLCLLGNYLLVETAFSAGFAPDLVVERVWREVVFEGGVSFELLVVGMRVRRTGQQE